MLSLLVCLISMVLVLVVFDGLMSYFTAESAKGNRIISDFITILILYFVIMSIMGSGTENGFVSDGIPFVSCMNQNTTLISIFHNDLGLFVKETAELISLIFLISYIEKVIPVSNVTVSIMITSRIILVLVGIIVNCLVMSFASKNEIFQWALTILQCVLSGTAIVVTPAMFIGKLLGVDSKNPALSYALKKLPDTALGKAFSAALSRTAVLLLGLMILESQVGPLSGLLTVGIELLGAIAPIIIMCIGISIIIKSVFR